MTFAAARAAHLAALAAAGWAVKGDLKVPHATSPDGRSRLWFKPQAVLAGCGTVLGDARSLWIDARTASTAQLIAAAEQLAAEQRRGYA